MEPSATHPLRFGVWARELSGRSDTPVPRASAGLVIVCLDSALARGRPPWDEVEAKRAISLTNPPRLRRRDQSDVERARARPHSQAGLALPQITAACATSDALGLPVARGAVTAHKCCDIASSTTVIGVS